MVYEPGGIHDDAATGWNYLQKENTELFLPETRVVCSSLFLLQLILVLSVSFYLLCPAAPMFFVPN